MWKDRCLQQQLENKKLQEELEEQQSKLTGSTLPGEPSITSAGSRDFSLTPITTGIEKMTDFALRQLQKKLEKEKTETEWKLKEYGWRLDQASAVSLQCHPESQRDPFSPPHRP